MTLARRTLFASLLGFLPVFAIEAADPQGPPPLVVEALRHKADDQGQLNRDQESSVGNRPPLALPPPLPENIRRGDPPPTLPHNLPAPEELREHFLLLRRFLELPPERLAQIRETIERIEKMDARRKATMLAKIREVQMPMQQPSEPAAQQGASAASKSITDPRPVVLESLSPEQRKQVEDLVAGFTAEQQAAFYQGLALRVELAREQAQATTAKDEKDAGSPKEAAASK